MTAIPEYIRIAAWNAAGHIYDPDNKCHAYATDIIAEALHAERLAAEKRGREEAAKIADDYVGRSERVSAWEACAAARNLAAAIRSGQ